MILYRNILGYHRNIKILRRSKNLYQMKVLQSYTSNSIEEYIIGSTSDITLIESIEKYNKLRNNSIKIINDDTMKDQLIWTMYSNNILIDYFKLEPYYLGKNKCSAYEISMKWFNTINQRQLLLYNYTTINTRQDNMNLCDGGKLQIELDKSLIAVHKSSFLSRGYQNIIFNSNNFTEDKIDNSPVTIADFAVQAIIMDYILKYFPNDRFIAEEDSKILKTNDILCNDILNILNSISINDKWTKEKLINIIDKGSADDTNGRVWILDPIDGTKGFIRNQHYCIALSLLIDGIPVLSTLGCPNLNLNRILQNSSPKDIEYIDPIKSYDLLKLPDIDSGVIFYAIDGLGAYARSLSMPLNSATEVQVSTINQSNDIKLCESVEQRYGDRKLTIFIQENLNLQNDFIRLDGQCKSGLVGSGGAEATLRLLPSNYMEKIWDVAPGYHYVKEAGGKVTDVNGNDIDFTKGRYLGELNGIISSNGLIHDKLINSLKQAKIKLNRE